jgi:hypothetical protein
MRPGRNDKRYYVLIDGQELVELKKYTWAMAEAYCLDTRIDNYKGTRPIGLWNWDLDCLEAVLDDVLKDYQATDSPEYQAMQSVIAKINALLDQAYPNRGQ